MAYARKGRQPGTGGETAGAEGYAGVALDVLEGAPDRGERVRVLVVPPGGTLQGLPEDVAVEVSCRIQEGMPVPRLTVPVSGECRELIEQVGACERMVVESILRGSRQHLRNALGHHPLVGPENVSACMEAFSWT
jgi:6-phospho-beta-glucosidase